MATLSISTLPYLSFLGYPDLWNGDTADGNASASAAIQAAIDASIGVLDLKPGATYLIDTPLVPKSDTLIRLNGSTLVAAGANHIFSTSTDGLHDFYVEGPGTLDGTAGYPVDTTIDKSTVAELYGIRIVSDNVYNLGFANLSFKKFAGGSIYILSRSGRTARVRDCTFADGHYRYKSIAFYAPDDSTEDEHFSDIIVSGCNIDGGGPTAFVDATNPNYLSSSDGVHFDVCRDSVIDATVVKNVAGIGIRIEQCIRVNITNSSTDETGAEGIIAYHHCANCSIKGNSVKAWGRLPFAASLLDYSGALVIPRESPQVSSAPWPADPTASSWWEVWPYITTGIVLETVTAWADKAYYADGPPATGTLAYRGNSGIAITQASSDTIVSGNHCIPNLDTVEGKYTHASDFGISTIHPVNGAADESSYRAGLITNNIAEGRVADIYTPAYRDPINENGPLGAVVVGTNIPSA